MARKKISEFTAKRLLSTFLDFPYAGVSLDSETASSTFSSKQTYVVKVDTGIKKRMKQGLVSLNVSADAVMTEAKKFFNKGYSHVLVEPFLTHEQRDEHYLSLTRFRDGIQLLYSPKGGIDIEDNQDAIQRFRLSFGIEELPKNIIQQTKLPESFMVKLLSFFDTYHISFLEINPLVIQGDTISFLDIAAEVDSTAEFFVHDGWTELDFRSGVIRKRTTEEDAVSDLASKSQAAFSLEVLNPDGNIFMMLSGGGASIVLADEVYNQGYGRELANYGEYSGNPKAEETYLYAKHILHLLLASKAKQKVLIIAGGVANFTDVRVTFKGLLKALDEQKSELKKQQVKVFVRRGGPYQEEGLAMMQRFLEEQDLYGIVSGPDMILTEVVTKALEYLRK